MTQTAASSAAALAGVVFSATIAAVTAAHSAGVVQAPPPAPPAAYTITHIANGFGSPDDLTVMPDGSILFGDFTNKALNIIRPGAAPTVLAAGIDEPEGIVVTKDGAIVVADQATNRILEVDPKTGAKKTLRRMVNNTGKEGVDGLGLDPRTGDILVPDSPNGRLLRMSRDGTRLQTIATGFVRPTGAAVEPNGNILVADEFGNAVYRLLPNGKRTRIASIYQPDDVVVGADGSIYVNSLKGIIYRIDPVSLRLTTLASGLQLPHGLGIDAQGNIVVAEAGRNRVFKLAPAQR